MIDLEALQAWVLSGDEKSRLLIAVNKICLAVPLDGDAGRQSLLDSLGEMLYQHQIALTKDHDLLTQPGCARGWCSGSSRG